VQVLAAADKFKGTASAGQVCAAIGHACWDLGLDCVEMPLADGGEGTLAVLGGANRTATVTGPLGNMVQAQWGMHKGVAIIEMAQASGLTLAGGAENNDPMGATTRGTGELIDRALNEGAKKIIVCLGGSATTDGGLGALAAISTPARLRAVDFLVACDVDTLFTDAAQVFAPQKGASRAQVALLTNRLEQLAQRYENDYHINVRNINGSGAAGGLAGALAALGATLTPGFDIVAEEVGFDEALRTADIVITGEGSLDDTSFTGKVVGSVLDYATEAKVPVHAIVGDIDNDMLPELRSLVTATSLTEKFGADMSMQQVLRCIEDAARDILRSAK
jgi:glycerate kinase